ncbi:MAG: hypothetical protein Q4F84_05570, partial [Fibrobacter sp.]|nr:hypothetical protein [Fibrobacter sp.]
MNIDKLYWIVEREKMNEPPTKKIEYPVQSQDRTLMFNPYRKWFGIPESECPPNYYRLLGIEKFEADKDVISMAADARMMLLRSLAGGQLAATSQQLLNEVSHARMLLLNEQTKFQYDQTLKETSHANDQKEIEKEHKEHLNCPHCHIKIDLTGAN